MHCLRVRPRPADAAAAEASRAAAERGQFGVGCADGPSAGGEVRPPASAWLPVDPARVTALLALQTQCD